MPIITRIPVDVTAWNDPAPRVEHNEALSDWYEDTPPTEDQELEGEALVKAFECRVGALALDYLKQHGAGIAVSEAPNRMDKFAEQASTIVSMSMKQQP